MAFSSHIFGITETWCIWDLRQWNCPSWLITIITKTERLQRCMVKFFVCQGLYSLYSTSHPRKSRTTSHIHQSPLLNSPLPSLPPYSTTSWIDCMSWNVCYLCLILSHSEVYIGDFNNVSRTSIGPLTLDSIPSPVCLLTSHTTQQSQHVTISTTSTLKNFKENVWMNWWKSMGTW